MLEFLILLPLVMVSILSVTFDVSVDELANASRGNYFYYDAYSGGQYRNIQERVHEFYTRMLDDSENEIEVGIKRGKSSPRAKWLQGQACDIQAIQNMHRRCSCKKPRKRCVRIEAPRSNVVSAMPECVIVERCDGICPHFSQCRATAVETITIPVIYLNLVVTESGSDLIPECTTASVEKHLKCGCSCAVTKEDCNQDQVFNPSTCRCECQQSKRAEDCQKSGKHWDTANCDCVCPPDIPNICSTGAFFHQELCRCVPVDRSFQSRRRKPPV